MAKAVRMARGNPAIFELSRALVRRLAQKDSLGEMRAVHRFVRDDIRYVRDIRGMETLQTPDNTLDIGQGDCDDKAILVNSLLDHLGYPTRFIAVGFRPGTFSHVYPEAFINGKGWIALETTEPWPLGRKVAGITRMEQNV